MSRLVPLSEKLEKFQKRKEVSKKKKIARQQKMYRARAAKIPKPPVDIFADLPLDTKLPILPIEPRGLLGKAGDEPVMPPHCVHVVRSNVKWPSIQRDIWMGHRTAVQIAEDYNVRKQDGSLDIVAIGKYRIWLKAQYAPIFDMLEELEKKALRQQIVQFVEQTHSAAMRGYEKSMTLTQRVKVGDANSSRIEEIDNPNLDAANNFLQTAIASAKAFSELSGVNQVPAPTSLHTPSTLDARKQTFNVMVLPKTADLQNTGGTAPLASLPPVTPLEPNVLDILSSMPDDDSPRS